MKSLHTLQSLLKAFEPGPNRGQRKQASPKTLKKILLQESPLAGFQYHRAQGIWPFLRVGEPLLLIREPLNQHDPDAIAVYFRSEQLGYVPRTENRILAGMLDRGEHVEAWIVRLLDEENPWRKIRFKVELAL